MKTTALYSPLQSSAYATYPPHLTCAPFCFEAIDFD